MAQSSIQEEKTVLEILPEDVSLTILEDQAVFIGQRLATYGPPQYWVPFWRL